MFWPSTPRHVTSSMRGNIPKSVARSDSTWKVSSCSPFPNPISHSSHIDRTISCGASSREHAHCTDLNRCLPQLRKFCHTWNSALRARICVPHGCHNFSTHTMPLRPSESLSDSVSTLNISSQPSTPPRRLSKNKKPKPKPKVAESWDDESLSSSSPSPSEDEGNNDSGIEEKDNTTKLSDVQKDVPRAPPPTPIGRIPPSGGMRAFADDDDGGDYLAPTSARAVAGQRSSTGVGADEKRPEKSTAVASRLIAAGLGVRAPRRTEEQREYDRAIREQERKKKEKEQEEERRKVQEREKAKAAMWGD